MASTHSRRNVYRATRRLDGTIALACLLGALIVAGLIATSEPPLSQSTNDEVNVWSINHN